MPLQRCSEARHAGFVTCSMHRREGQLYQLAGWGLNNHCPCPGAECAQPLSSRPTCNDCGGVASGGRFRDRFHWPIRVVSVMLHGNEVREQARRQCRRAKGSLSWHAAAVGIRAASRSGAVRREDGSSPHLRNPDIRVRSGHAHQAAGRKVQPGAAHGRAVKQQALVRCSTRCSRRCPAGVNATLQSFSRVSLCLQSKRKPSREGKPGSPGSGG